MPALDQLKNLLRAGNIVGGTLDADWQRMAAISPSGPRSHADSTAWPNLRLVTNGPSHRARPAVMACVAAGAPGNSEVLRQASAAARESDCEFYAVLADPPRMRFANARVRALI